MILKPLSESIMNANNEIFKKLLTVDELFELYYQIGKSIFTNIDIENINKDRESKNNSIMLLSGTFFVGFNSESGIYFQKTVIENKALFTEILYKMLQENYPEAFRFINEVEIRYDESVAEYYTKRNSIKLDLSGLIMLLDGMNIIHLKDNLVYFVESTFLERITKVTNEKRKTSLIELKKHLDLQEQLGNEAEIAAMEFEKTQLMVHNIVQQPERVSLYDVAAGYDIVSYMTVDSCVPDKFIEVKSCADESMQFYISRNEIETAKNKRRHYYLYLFNRQIKEFVVIQDPYNVLFENVDENWAIEPHAYRIHFLMK